MVRAPLEHNDYRGHHILGEPLTSRHDSGRNHHVMVLVRTAGLALTVPAMAAHRQGHQADCPGRPQHPWGHHRRETVSVGGVADALHVHPPLNSIPSVRALSSSADRPSPGRRPNPQFPTRIATACRRSSQTWAPPSRRQAVQTDVGGRRRSCHPRPPSEWQGARSPAQGRRPAPRPARRGGRACRRW